MSLESSQENMLSHNSNVTFPFNSAMKTVEADKTQASEVQVRTLKKLEKTMAR